MDRLKVLEVEYNGIYGTIRKLTNESNIMNYLAQLERGIDNKDYELVKYSVGEIINWYDNNIEVIRSNRFVHNFDSHQKNMSFLKKIYTELSPEDFVGTISEKIENKRAEKLIFLSHKSNDKKYGDALRDFIIGLGVQDNQLIYTSHPLHKIPMDKNIYDYLRNNINSEIFMIIL